MIKYEPPSKNKFLDMLDTSQTQKTNKTFNLNTTNSGTILNPKLSNHFTSTDTCYCDVPWHDDAALAGHAENDVRKFVVRNKADIAPVDWCFGRCNNRTLAIQAWISPAGRETPSEQALGVFELQQRSFQSMMWSYFRFRRCLRWRYPRSEWFHPTPYSQGSARAPRYSCVRNGGSRSSSASCLLGKLAAQDADVQGRRSGYAFGDVLGRLLLCVGFVSAEVPANVKENIWKWGW